MTLRHIPWSSLRFCVDGKIYSGEEGLLKWESAKLLKYKDEIKQASLPKDYLEASKQRSDLIAALSAAVIL